MTRSSAQHSHYLFDYAPVCVVISAAPPVRPRRPDTHGTVTHVTRLRALNYIIHRSPTHVPRGTLQMTFLWRMHVQNVRTVGGRGRCRGQPPLPGKHISVRPLFRPRDCRRITLERISTRYFRPNCFINADTLFSSWNSSFTCDKNLLLAKILLETPQKPRKFH